MKKSIKNFVRTEVFKGYTIMVYGELWEDGYVDGIVIKRAKFSKDGSRVMDESTTGEEILLKRPYTRTRYFNMGWAICTPDDKFNELAGVELCKKRFRKSPLKTETGLFLTKDMIYALLDNEINYIKKNWKKFVPKHSTKFSDVLKQVVDQVMSSKKEEKFVKPNDAEEQTFEIEFDEDPATVEEEKKEPETNVQEIKEGDYIFVLTDKEHAGVEEVGYVKHVDDENVYCSWTMRSGSSPLGDSLRMFRFSSGEKDIHYSRKNVRIATKEEISHALKAIEQSTQFRWNIGTKLLEMKFF